MLRNKPKLAYSGLAVILSNPSRFDKLSLLSANGGELFNNYCLRPEMNLMQCDVRLMEDTSDFLAGTKGVLLLGEAAMHEWCVQTRTNTLNEMRGTILNVRNLPAVASFFPQDAADIRTYEQQLNTDSKEYTIDEESFAEDSEGDVKALSPTKRANYAFWLKADVKKLKRLVSGGGLSTSATPTYRIYPSADEVIQILQREKGQFLYFDIETDYEEQNLLCFSFSFGGSPSIIYCVPILDYNYSWAYSSLHYILRALAVAIRDNVIVAHNGASFDFFVLAYKYGIPVGKCYDTMLAMHRCFPDIEKSLGHCTSLWTDEPFHKDSDSRAYRTYDHMMQKLKYCGKDVWTMSLIYKEITAYAKKIPGLESSIQCAMDSIRPYLITSLQGIRYSQTKVDALKKENDRLMMQYLRIIRLLIGEQGMAECKSAVKGKAKGFASSNTQCCNYFHDQLGYAVMFKSQKTGKPSLGKKMMFRLALKYPNPVITFTLLYRQIAKEYGALKFNPWKDDDNKITKTVDSNQEEFRGTGFTLA